MTTQETAAAPETTPARRFRRPFYEVESGEEGYRIEVLMPGVAKDGVSVSLNGRVLKIEGVRQDRPQPAWSPVLRELNWDDYRLELELNVRVNESGITAEVNEGVLRLSLPKAEEAKPRRIEVS